jgi:O-antigen/teichoic acid export membrane protein
MFSGFALHVVAKIVFVLVSYLMHMYLGKTLTPAEYGLVGVIITVITFNYNFLTNGARQAASKTLAIQKYNEKDIVKKSVIVQFTIALVLTLINYFGADLISAFLQAPELAPYIRLTAFVIPFTAGYFLFVGVLNGLHLFVIEATIVGIYPILRLSIIPYIEFIYSDSASATIMAFVTAAAVSLILCLLYMFRVLPKLDASRPKITNVAYANNVVGFLGFFLGTTAVLNVDMLMVNAFVQEANAVGYYTGATNFAKASYYLLTAVYLVALPTISKKYNDGDIQGSCNTIKRFLELIALGILPVVSIVAPTAGNLMSAFYKPEYRIAELPTAILMLSQFLIGLFVVINVILCSAIKPRFSTIVAWIILAAELLFGYLLIPVFSITGSALASLLCAVVGIIITIPRFLKVFPDIWSMKLTKLIGLNVMIALIMFIISKIWITDNLLLVLVFYAVVYFSFIGLAYVLKITSIKELIKSFKK